MAKKKKTSTENTAPQEMEKALEKSSEQQSGSQEETVSGDAEAEDGEEGRGDHTWDRGNWGALCLLLRPTVPGLVEQQGHSQGRRWGTHPFLPTSVTLETVTFQG